MVLPAIGILGGSVLGSQLTSSTGASGGLGKIISQLAGAFPVGFLGGAGYGSGLRFGFEKVFDAIFKHIPTQGVGDAIKIMQGGFGIGNNFVQQANAQSQESLPVKVGDIASDKPQFQDIVKHTNNPITIGNLVQQDQKHQEYVQQVQQSPLLVGGAKGGPINLAKSQGNYHTLKWQKQYKFLGKLKVVTVSQSGTEDFIKKYVKDQANYWTQLAKKPGNQHALDNVLSIRTAFKDLFGYWV